MKFPYWFDYEGEVDENGKPCGHGEAIDRFKDKYSCTWFDSGKHGLGKSICV